MEEISATLKDVKNIKEVAPFIPPVWLLQKPDRSWQLAVVYGKIIQIVTPIAIVVSQMVTS